MALRRDDLRVSMGGDRGDFDLWLEFSNPRKGRGHTRIRKMPAADYFAGQRGDATTEFLLGDASERNGVVARWLSERVTETAPLTLNEELLRRIEVLQRGRSRALFG